MRERRDFVYILFDVCIELRCKQEFLNNLCPDTFGAGSGYKRDNKGLKRVKKVKGEKKFSNP